MRGGEGAAAVGVPVAVLAEDKIVGGASNGDGVGAAVITDLRSDVLAAEGVGGVDMAIAEKAEPGEIGSAEEDRNLLIAEIAWDALSGSRFGAHHLSLSLCSSAQT